MGNKRDGETSEPSILGQAPVKDAQLDALFKTPVEYAPRESESEMESDEDVAARAQALRGNRVGRSVDIAEAVSRAQLAALGEEVGDVGSESDSEVQDDQADDERTVFIGNVPVDCAIKTSLKRRLVSHILKHAKPYDYKIAAESIRFRGLSFSSKVFGRRGHIDGESHKDARSRTWKQDTSKGVSPGLRDSEKRKIAAMRGEVNENRQECIAYLKLSIPAEADVRSAVECVVEGAHGTVFEGHTLRCDTVWDRSSANKFALSHQSSDLPLSISKHLVSPETVKRTLFIGGLDFAETDESVWSAVQEYVSSVRGNNNWVKAVRLLRDPNLGIGKGIAYVEFVDPECVDVVIASTLNKPLKVSKRKVRVERCKTMAAMASIARKKAQQRKKLEQQQEKSQKTKKSAPKENVALSKRSQTEIEARASQLAALSAEERKSLKAADAERAQRRLNKKLAKRGESAKDPKTAKGHKANKVLGRPSRQEVRERKFKASKRK